MADAFVFDHVRTPRGRGKKDGALHAVSTVELAAQAIRVADHIKDTYIRGGRPQAQLGAESVRPRDDS